MEVHLVELDALSVTRETEAAQMPGAATGVLLKKHFSTVGN